MIKEELPNISLDILADQPDVLLTYFAAQVHLAFNNEMRPSPTRIIEVARRLGITRQQCLLLLSARTYVSAIVEMPRLSTDSEYREYSLASADDYCVVAVSNVIQKIKEFPENKKEIFDKLPEMLQKFDRKLSTDTGGAPVRPFWDYNKISLFLRTLFLEHHVTTNSGMLVGVSTTGPHRAGCSSSGNTTRPRRRPSAAT